MKPFCMKESFCLSITVDLQREVDVLVINLLTLSERRVAVFDQVKLMFTYTVPGAPVVGWRSF